MKFHKLEFGVYLAMLKRNLLTSLIAKKIEGTNLKKTAESLKTLKMKKLQLK